MNQKQQGTTAVKQQQETKQMSLIQFEKTLGDSVQNRIAELTKQGRLDLPTTYSVGNALQSAWLKILQTKTKDGRPVIEVCTKESIANSLLDMAILGLNPAKDQCYFIPYGQTLTCFVSYFGKCAALKRIKGIETEPIATLIYDGDALKLGYTELGEELVTEHETSWENKFRGVIVGGYATVMYQGVKRSAVMTMPEIKEAWTKSISDPNHKQFTGEFAKRTLINRLVKMILKTTNDDDLLAETVIKTEQEHYDFEPEVIAEEKAKLEIAANANSGAVIDIVTTPEPAKAEERHAKAEEAVKAEPQEKTQSSVARSMF
ncbi:MAG: recombination and repair protein RecT [Tenericutes bacterium ADurb.BinA124]|nr:MAG: recombination and repair protein RecT [Tenericutes bacterium ADurb.BinA124]